MRKHVGCDSVDVYSDNIVPSSLCPSTFRTLASLQPVPFWTQTVY